MDFIRITDKNNKDFHKAWELYENSFPIHERRTLETHKKALDNENFYCTYVMEDDTFIGILFYWKLNNYIYVEHFAISPELRNHGFGTKVLNEFTSNNDNIILEIDPLEDEVSIKRYHFYKNIGFKLHDFDHIQLPYRKDYEGYVLRILSHSIDLTEDSYNEFYKLLFDSLTKYCED